MWYEWFFDGVGTEFIIFIIDLIVGLSSVYKLSIKNNGIKKQKAKDNAKQNQQLEIELTESSKGSDIDGNIRQVQKAGANSEQIQIARIKR